MDVKPPLKFVQLRTMKLMDISVSHFSIQSYGNDMIVHKEGTNTVIFNCINEPDFVGQFPYVNARIELPEIYPLSILLKEINLQKIYTEANVLEQQEMGLDPILVVESSQDPIKPQVLKAQLSPNSNNKLLIITTYGTCMILQKNLNTRQWNEEICNLTTILIRDIYPSTKSHEEILNYENLKKYINKYICTACAWHDTDEFIYLANANSYILVFKYDEKNNENLLTFYCQQKTNMKRICNLKAFDNFLIAVSIDGIIELYRLYHGNGNSLKLTTQIVHQETLWKYHDNMSCTQLIVQKNEKTNGYSILCAKSAFIINFQISIMGKLLGCGRMRLPGIKITGIEQMNNNEYVITTMTGKVFKLKLNLNYDNNNDINSKINIEMEKEQAELTQIDTEVNLGNEIREIRGVCTTKNKSLWFFLLHSSEHEVSRQSGIYSTLSVFKLQTFEPLEILKNLKFDIIDPYFDIILAFRMDVWAEKDGASGKYEQFMPLNETTILPTKLDNEFLKKLRLRFEIAKVNFRRSNFKLQKENEVFLSELEFLELAVHITQIILRLKFLKENVKNLTIFQQKSAYFMQKAFHIYLKKLKNSFTQEGSLKNHQKVKEVVLKFVNLCSEIYERNFQENFLPAKLEFDDVCMFCNKPLGLQFLDCNDGHTLSRCCISFAQIPNFFQLHCTQCGVMAFKDETNPNILKELFPEDENVKCPFCCSSLVNA